MDLSKKYLVISKKHSIIINDRLRKILQILLHRNKRDINLNNVDKLLEKVINDVLFMEYFSNKYIMKLPSIIGKNNITKLDLPNCNIKELPQFWYGLTSLNCRNNKLKELPELPKSLIHLNCSYNYLDKLPYIHKKIKNIYCSHNYLTEMPPIERNSQLMNLHCSYNYIETLILSINVGSLETFLCSFNNMKKIIFNSKKTYSKTFYVKYLNCSNNRLKSIPIINICNLKCNNNKFKRLITMKNYSSFHYYRKLNFSNNKINKIGNLNNNFEHIIKNNKKIIYKIMTKYKTIHLYKGLELSTFYSAIYMKKNLLIYLYNSKKKYI